MCPPTYTPAYLDGIILGNYHNKVPNAHVTYFSISSEKNTLEAKKAIREACKRYSGNQFLPTLLDAPTGLADLFKIARILYKPAQHLIMVGQAGTSKHELVQLAAIMTETPMLELKCAPFGEPLEFAYNLRQIILSVAKFSKGTFVVVND